MLNTRGAQFIFGNDIKEYLEEVWSKFVDLELRRNDENTAEHASEREANIKWFTNELKTLDSRFESYMKLKH